MGSGNSTKNKQMKKAIFLDRDGVINDNSVAYYVHKLEDFIINEGVFESLKIFQKKGFLLIIITNQGGIAKGQYKKSDVEIINKYIKSEFSKQGIDIADIFYCPHHSDISKCLCRKPNSLLLEKAVAKYNIDTSKSYMIGDSLRDIEAAQNINIQGIKVDANKNLFKSILKTEFAHLVS